MTVVGWLVLCEQRDHDRLRGYRSILDLMQNRLSVMNEHSYNVPEIWLDFLYILLS